MLNYIENQTKVTPGESEDTPEITVSKINGARSEIKTPGEDVLAIKTIKMGENKLLQAIKILFNACLSEGTTPSECNTFQYVYIKWRTQ